MFDTRVFLGAAKGRSSSPALTKSCEALCCTHFSCTRCGSRRQRVAKSHRCGSVTCTGGSTWPSVPLQHLRGNIERHPGLQGLFRAGFSNCSPASQQKVFSAFVAWLSATFCLSPEQAFCTAESAALCSVRLHLYEAGRACYLLVRAITSVQNAWQVDKKWQLTSLAIKCRILLLVEEWEGTF